MVLEEYVPQEVCRLLNTVLEHFFSDVSAVHATNDQRIDALPYAIGQLVANLDAQSTDLIKNFFLQPLEGL